MNAILGSLDVELLGMRLVKARKEIYVKEVPRKVEDLVRRVAYKFHDGADDEGMRRKMNEFKTLVLVLRG